jgi:tripartite-type tricarboxylate transporter receptor subunit TctC
MFKPKKILIVFMFMMVFSGLFLADALLAAEKYPSKPITLIVPWSAGGRSEMTVRVWAPALEKEIKQPVAIVCKPGGTGLVGAEDVARSKPNGYTSGIFATSHITSQYTSNPPMDFNRFEHVCINHIYPFAVMAHAESPWRTFKDVVEYSKKNPGKVKVANAGAGSIGHVLAGDLARVAGLKWIHVPYKGDGPGGVGLASKEVDLWMAPASAGAALIKAGTVKVLNIATQKRFSLYPDAPTFVEQGIDFVGEGVEMQQMAKGTPREIIDIFNAAMKRALSRPEVIQGMKNMYLIPGFEGPEETRRYIEKISAKLAPTIKELGLWIAPTTK